MPRKNMSLSSSSLLKEKEVTPSGCGGSGPGFCAFPSLPSFQDFWTQCWGLGVFVGEKKEHLFQVLSKNRSREGKMAEFL